MAFVSLVRHKTTPSLLFLNLNATKPQNLEKHKCIFTYLKFYLQLKSELTGFFKIKQKKNPMMINNKACNIESSAQKYNFEEA